jgi:hypothetical protein
MYADNETLQEVIGKTNRSIVFPFGREVNPEAQLFLVINHGTNFRILWAGDQFRAL